MWQLGRQFRRRRSDEAEATTTTEDEYPSARQLQAATATGVSVTTKPSECLTTSGSPNATMTTYRVGLVGIDPGVRASGIDEVGVSPTQHRTALVAILQAAHAGELAAAYAYRAHWKSRVGERRRWERDEIRRIEDSEWHHRGQVRVMLTELGSGPVRWREVLMGGVGRFFGVLCYVTFRFAPMYAAGRLEAMNVSQYVDAATHARAAGLEDYATKLDEMVAEEARHEAWFSDQVRGHWALPIAFALGRWRPAPAVATSSDR